MKIRDGFLLRQVAGQYVVIPTGETTVDLNLMITLNETGAFLWEKLQAETTEEALVSALCAEYEVDAATAADHVRQFVAKLCDHDILG